MITFTLPDQRSATEPPEARGIARDEVRLLVAADAVRHARFRDLPCFLHPGDLLVVNDSATLPAAVDATRADGRPATVHVAREMPGPAWVVEVRPAVGATGPVPDAVAGERLTLPGGVALTLLRPFPQPDSSRLWQAGVRGADDGLPAYLARFGRPVTYSYVTGRWPLAAYQTVFARHPGSAEMPSAGRPFTRAVLARLARAGVAVTPLTLHTGLSSAEAGEPPASEPYRVPATTARLVNRTRRRGGRVVAVGTTVVRALETVADADGLVRAGEGWTDLVLGPDRPVRVVDGIVTGWHEPGASHLDLLEAVAGRERVAAAYEAAVAEGYLWHEFGDSALLWR